MTPFEIARFRFDVTPPIGHSLCGGWIPPISEVEDPLEAIGLVLLGSDKPIVLCAVDWTGILNEAHVAWRTALAEAAGTTPDRVAAQCVHQHSAPMVCLEAERIVAAEGDLPHIVDTDFFRRCLERAREAVSKSLKEARPLTHIAHGRAKVDKVASNRRIHRDANNRVIATRDSNGPTAELRALPEGLIDPWLRTIAFYDNETKLAACHYYATHPMSYYGVGRATSDFAGLARKRRQKDEPGCLQVYFTGCAGNIAAGKYNDGTPPLRPILTQRLYDGIVQSEQSLERFALNDLTWRTVEILPPPRETLSATLLQKEISNHDNTVVARNRPSFMLSWLNRYEKKIPIVVSALHMNREITLLHLPAECFIEYQLRAQQIDPSRWLAIAAYGDGGPWYIPTREEYPLGGYETSVAFCDPQIDELITGAMRDLITNNP